MNLVDSSGWLAFFADTKNAAKFAKPLQEMARLVIPTIVMYEVCKVMLREKNEEAALVAQAHMQQGVIVPLTPQLAVNAARESIDNRMPMADSIILATARHYNAQIWTQDEHFKGMAKVTYLQS